MVYRKANSHFTYIKVPDFNKKYGYENIILLRPFNISSNLISGNWSIYYNYNGKQYIRGKSYNSSLAPEWVVGRLIKVFKYYNKTPEIFLTEKGKKDKILFSRLFKFKNKCEYLPDFEYDPEFHYEKIMEIDYNGVTKCWEFIGDCCQTPEQPIKCWLEILSQLRQDNPYKDFNEIFDYKKIINEVLDK